jgi:hypothetical protein
VPPFSGSAGRGVGREAPSVCRALVPAGSEPGRRSDELLVQRELTTGTRRGPTTARPNGAGVYAEPREPGEMLVVHHVGVPCRGSFWELAPEPAPSEGPGALHRATEGGYGTLGGWEERSEAQLAGVYPPVPEPGQQLPTRYLDWRWRRCLATHPTYTTWPRYTWHVCRRRPEIRPHQQMSCVLAWEYSLILHPNDCPCEPSLVEGILTSNATCCICIHSYDTHADPSTKTTLRRH